MALTKRNYIDRQTVITAQNLNDIQDNIIQNTEDINQKYEKPADGIPESDLSNDVQMKLNSGGGSEAPIVSYRQYGAVLDGVTDDSAAVIAAHTYANANGYKVEEHSGALRVNFQVMVQTDCDFTGLSFIVDDATPDSAYRIFHDAQTFGGVEYDGDYSDAYPAIMAGTENAPTMSNGAVNCPSAVLYGKYFVVDKGNLYIGKRLNGSTLDSTYDTCTQPIMVDNEGQLIGAPLARGASKMRCRWISDVFESPITWRGGRIIIKRTTYANVAMIMVERNNTHISDIAIQPEIAPRSGVSGDGGVIKVLRCCNITLERIRGLNNSSNAKQETSYMVNAVYAANVVYRDCIWTEGWGGIATHNVSSVSFYNCIVNRVDNHRNMFGDWRIEGCTFIGIGYIVLGCGDANVYVSNCRFAKSIARQPYYIGLRHDYPTAFGGRIFLANVVADDATHSTTAVFDYYRRAALPEESDYDGSTDFGTPSLWVSKIEHDAQSLVVNEDEVYGTQVTVIEDATKANVREWGFAYKSEVEGVERELARIEPFDWSKLANASYPTGFRNGFFDGATGKSYTNTAWSRTRAALPRVDGHCILRSDYNIRVGVFTEFPSYVNNGDNSAVFVETLEAVNGEPLRFEVKKELYYIVYLDCPYSNIADNLPKLDYISANVQTVSVINENSTEEQIPSAKAVWDLFNSIPNAEGVGF